MDNTLKEWKTDMYCKLKDKLDTFDWTSINTPEKVKEVYQLIFQYEEVTGTKYIKQSKEDSII